MKICMGICALSMIAPELLWAENDRRVQDQEQVLPPVVVTATRLKDAEEEATRIAGKATVITAQDIQKLGAKTVQEVLQYQTGVVVYDLIGNEFQSTVDLRGFNGQPVPATSVFVDGVRVNEPDFNTVNFDLIPIDDIDRIEILPGTATVFGRNALGGVINITTKRGRKDKPHFGVEAGGGSFGRQKYTFNTDGPLPLSNFDYYFGVTRELTDGFRDASGGRITRLFSKLGYQLGQQSNVTLSYTHVQDHLKQASSLRLGDLRIDRKANAHPGDFFDADLHLVALNVRQKLPAGFSLAINSFLRDHDDLAFVKFQSGDSLLRTAIFSSGGTIQLTHDGAILDRKNLLTLGLESGRNRFDITNSGVFFGFRFLTKQLTKEDVVGLYLSDSLNLLESLILSAGFRYDWDRFDFTDKIDASLNGTKSFHRLSPKAGLVFVPLEDLSLSFSYSEGIRTPTVSEIFAQGPFGSNPSLVPMRSQNFEVGAKGKLTSWLDASLAFFYMPVRDEISFVVTDPVSLIGKNENIDRTLRRGIEVSLNGRYGKLIDGFLNYTVMKATFETNFLVFPLTFPAPVRQVEKGNDLPLVPRNRVGLGVNFHPLNDLTLSLLGTYVGGQFLLNDEPNQFKKLAEYFVLSSKVSFKRGPWTGHVTVNNLSNRKYSTSGILGLEPLLSVTAPFLIPAPGVNVSAGLTFRY
jgi:outer membrane receptor protein involved in Fe transport